MYSLYARSSCSTRIGVVKAVTHLFLSGFSHDVFLRHMSSRYLLLKSFFVKLIGTTVTHVVIPTGDLRNPIQPVAHRATDAHIQHILGYNKYRLNTECSHGEGNHSGEAHAWEISVFMFWERRSAVRHLSRWAWLFRCKVHISLMDLCLPRKGNGVMTYLFIFYYYYYNDIFKEIQRHFCADILICRNKTIVHIEIINDIITY